MSPLRRWIGAWSLAAVLGLTSVACGTTASAPEASSSAFLLSPDVESITVEIDYQSGAAPFVGRAGQLDDVWRIATDNLARMLRAGGKSWSLPTSLDAMQELGDVTGTTFTSDAIQRIAHDHRSASASASAASVYVVFLDGRYADETGTRDDVLGVTLGHSGVIAMFKPVIASADASFEGVAKFVEQTTLVHELGHAFGLVGDDLAETSPHSDPAHAHHCSNPSCAMYWSNEGLSSAVAFARRFMRSGSTILFDSACLADLDAAAQR